MSQAFHWDILWAFSKGGKTAGDGRYYHEHITRKTKVIGMLPLRLIPDFRNLGTHHLSGADLLGNSNSKSNSNSNSNSNSKSNSNSSSNSNIDSPERISSQTGRQPVCQDYFLNIVKYF
jgi:hypothetical protein